MLNLLIFIGDKPIVSVTDLDAQSEKVSPQTLAQRWSSAIQEDLRKGRAMQTRKIWWPRSLMTLLIVFVAFCALLLLKRLRLRLFPALAAQRNRILPVRFRGLELISKEPLYRTIERLGWVIYGLLVLIVMSAALLLIFGQFPATRGYVYQVLVWIWQPLVRIFSGFVNYLPNLFYILVIAVVTRVVIRVVNFVFERAHRGVISLEPWIQQDVARPTSQIFKAVLIVLALFFIAPLIPGTGSTAARGISVILGLMVSFGSTSTVGNIIAGVVLTYMRPFMIWRSSENGRYSR